MENVIKERPILFSGPMVRALLDGSKTQTRRAIKNVGIGVKSRQPKPVPDYTGRFVNSAGSNLWAAFGSGEARPDGVQNTVNTMRSGWFPCPYGQPGDRLWVRETWAANACLNNVPPSAFPDGDTEIYYGATYPNKSHFVWRPSIHMCRWMSRILVEIVAVRVERLQDISEADAVAEGISPLFSAAEIANTRPPMPFATPAESGWLNYLWHGHHDLSAKQVAGWPYQFSSYDSAKDSYSSLWAKINGLESWAANLWVWVVEFKVLAPTIQEGKQS